MIHKYELNFQFRILYLVHVNPKSSRLLRYEIDEKAALAR